MTTMIDRARELRQRWTDAERVMWQVLRNRRMKRWKFRREHQIEGFILDFYCPSEKLIVELDGAAHFNIAQQNYDYERTLKLETEGFTLVRFENKEVFENLDFV